MLIITKPIKEDLHYTEREGPLLCSQNPATETQIEPGYSDNTIIYKSILILFSHQRLATSCGTFP